MQLHIHISAALVQTKNRGKRGKTPRKNCTLALRIGFNFVCFVFSVFRHQFELKHSIESPVRSKEHATS